jgi:hypothetical protein
MKFEKIVQNYSRITQAAELQQHYENFRKTKHYSNTSQSNFISLVIKTPSHAASTSSVVGIISVVRSPEVGQGTKLAISTTATLSTITIWIPFVA